MTRLNKNKRSGRINTLCRSIFILVLALSGVMLQSAPPSETLAPYSHTSTASQEKFSESNPSCLIGAGLIALAGIAILTAFAEIKRSKRILPED